MTERPPVDCRNIKTKMTILENNEQKGCDTDNPASQSKQSAGKRVRASFWLLIGR